MMLKRILDKYWSWKRRRAEQTLVDAYKRTAPPGSPPSVDPQINAYYARLREKPQQMTPNQAAAERVRQTTLAHAKDPPRKPDYIDKSGMGHYDKLTVRVIGMLPEMGAPYDDLTPAERLQHQRLKDPDYEGERYTSHTHVLYVGTGRGRSK